MSKIIKCKVDIAKDDYGMYKVEASGPCQEFEITRAKNTASMRNLAGNIDGATFDTWEESRVEDFSSKVIHQVILPMKMDVTAETGMYPQITVWDPRSRHFHSAIITREQQVEGKPTFNQIGIMGKCLETMINIPQRGEMHANTKSNKIGRAHV